MTKKVSYIDWENRNIIGKSGKVYLIRPELTASKLWAEYQIKGALLGSGWSFENNLKAWLYVREVLRTGKENAQGNTANALNKIDEVLDAMKRFKETEYNAEVEFCSIFCKTENEPIDLNDESIIRRKYEDWSEIPQYFFLILCEMSIQWYKEGLQKLKEQTGKEIKLSYQPKQTPLKSENNTD